MRRNRHLLLAASACLAITVPVIAKDPASGTTQTLTPKEQLGKSIFFDENLSLNNNQSCATCHGLEAGWTGPDSDINAHGAVYEGSIPGAFGDRKLPSAAYATQSPILFMNRKGLFTGGNFSDGRATGQRPLFTDYPFDTLGIPQNPENAVHVSNPSFVDPGLGGFLASRPEYAAYADANRGKHKVPTVRNVANGLSDGITKAYGHNG